MRWKKRGDIFEADCNDDEFDIAGILNVEPVKESNFKEMIKNPLMIWIVNKD